MKKTIKKKQEKQVHVDPGKALAIRKIEYMDANRVTGKMIDDYLFGSNTKLTDEQKTMFKAIAIQQNLNPFKREIHAVLYEISEKQYEKWVKTGRYNMSVVTGYEVYLKRAERTGDLEYWNITTTGKIDVEHYWNSTFEAVCTIKRKSRSKEFTWTLKFTQIAPKDKADNTTIYLNAFWKKDPEFMVKKCCMAQAHRIYFSDEMGSMPYIREELTEIEVPPMIETISRPELPIPKAHNPYLDLDKPFGAWAGKWAGKTAMECPVSFMMSIAKDWENEKAILELAETKIEGKIKTMEIELSMTEADRDHVIKKVMKKTELSGLQDKYAYAEILLKEKESQTKAKKGG